MTTWEQARAIVERGQIPISVQRRADGGGYRAVVAIPFADGRMMLVQASCDLQQAAQASGLDFDRVATQVGRVVSDQMYCALERGARQPMMVGAEQRVRDFADAAHFGWAVLTKKQRAMFGNDVHRWWGALGVDARVSSRASFAALRAERPNDTPAQAQKWWGEIGKKGRMARRSKYTKGYGDDLLSDLGNAVKKAGDIATLGPIARQIPIVKNLHRAVQQLQNAPLNAAMDVAAGKRIDRAAMGQLKASLASAKTLAPYVQSIVSFVPGVGTGLSAGLGAAVALASGKPISEAMLAAVRGSVPGGALGQAVFDVTSAVASGKPIEQIALSALPLEPSAKDALVRGAKAVRALAEGKPVTAVVLDQALDGLPKALQSSAQISVALTEARKLQRAAEQVAGPAVKSIAKQATQLAKAGVLDDPKKLGTMALKEALAAPLNPATKGKRVPKAEQVGRQLRAVAKSQASKAALLKAAKQLAQPAVRLQLDRVAGTALGAQLNAAITAARIVEQGRSSAPGSAKQRKAIAAARRALAAAPAAVSKSLPAPKSRDVRRYVVELTRVTS